MWRLQSTCMWLCYCYHQALLLSPTSDFITAYNTATTDNNPTSLKASTGLPKSSPSTQKPSFYVCSQFQQKLLHFTTHPHLSVEVNVQWNQSRKHNLDTYSKQVFKKLREISHRSELKVTRCPLLCNCSEQCKKADKAIIVKIIGKGKGLQVKDSKLCSWHHGARANVLCEGYWLTRPSQVVLQNHSSC